MTYTLTVAPTTLKAEIKKLENFLQEYETQYTRMKTAVNQLELDSKQLSAINSSVEAMYSQFTKMKTYLDSGVIDVFETAVTEYNKADVTK